MAVIRWSRLSKEVLALGEFQDKESFFNMVDRIKFKGGGGQVHKALNMLVDSTLNVQSPRGVERYKSQTASY